MRVQSLTAVRSRGSPGPRVGFTLVEILAVLAVILVLAGLTLGLAQQVFSRSAEAVARADLEVLALALEQYRSRAYDYPWVDTPPVDGNRPRPGGASALLRALLGYRATDPARPAFGGRGNFHQSELLQYGGNFQPGIGDDPGHAYPMDPWGNPYLYLYNPTYPKEESIWRGPQFLLLSAGPDGEVFLPPDLFTTGLHDREAYFNHPANRDNIEWNF